VEALVEGVQRDPLGARSKSTSYIRDSKEHSKFCIRVVILHVCAVMILSLSLSVLATSSAKDVGGYVQQPFHQSPRSTFACLLCVRYTVVFYGCFLVIEAHGGTWRS